MTVAYQVFSDKLFEVMLPLCLLYSGFKIKYFE